MFNNNNQINCGVNYYDSVANQYNILSNKNEQIHNLQVSNSKNNRDHQEKNIENYIDTIKGNKRVFSGNEKNYSNNNNHNNSYTSNKLYPIIEECKKNQRKGDLCRIDEKLNNLQYEEFNNNLINGKNVNNFYFTNLDKMHKQAKKKQRKKQKYLNTIVLMKREIDADKIEEKKQERAKSATNINNLYILKKNKINENSQKKNFNKNCYNLEYADNQEDNVSQSEKNVIKKAFNNPNFYISKNNFLRNLKNSIEKENDDKTNNFIGPEDLDDHDEKKNKDFLNDYIINTSSRKKLNQYNNLDIADLMTTNIKDNLSFLNQNQEKKKPESPFLTSTKKRRKSQSRNSPNKGLCKNKNFDFLSEEKAIEKVFQQQKKNKKRMSKAKKLNNLIEKIKKMNNIYDDEKYTQLTPFIRTNVFCDDLTYEQVVDGIKTFELSHTKSKYKKNMKKIDKVFNPKSTESKLVKDCNKKISVYSKSLRKKINTQENMKIKGAIVRKRENEDDYVFKRQVRTESLKYQENNGMFIYSNGKGYKTQNYERLYSSKYSISKVDE